MPPGRLSMCLALSVLLVTSCSSRYPPHDVPPPAPLTPIVEFPTFVLPATPAPRPRIQPIFTNDLEDARTFFLILKIAMTAGDSATVAGNVLYPIEVNVNGVVTTVASAAEFEQSYAAIFDPDLQAAIMAADEQDLRLMPGGVSAADGALWFNLLCLDAACSETGFRITAINN